MYDRIQRGWEHASTELSGTEAFWQRSALGLSLFRDVQRVLLPHVGGDLLDAGAGKLPYRHILRPRCRTYTSLDVTKAHPELDAVGDVQDLPFPDARFDTVFTTEVLEHVPDPEQALSEIRRVLKPGGKLLLSVPHLFYLHNEPHDFFRYTKYGLNVLLERAGFRVRAIEPSGGLFSFLQGLGATALTGLTYGIPVIGDVCFTVNRWSGRFVIWLDERTDTRKLLPLHYVGVAEKPPG